MTDGLKILDRVLGRETKRTIRDQNSLIVQLDSKLKEAEKGNLPGLLKEITSLWSEPIDVPISESIRIIDPIYGEILIEDTLVPIFLQPLVQRLSHVRQLSFSYITHPTAQHTRLAHSLGVAKTAETAVLGIFRRGHLYNGTTGETRLEVDSEEIKQLILKVKLSGILHDLGHGPFGHALDRYIGYATKVGLKDVDKKYSQSYINGILTEPIKACGFDPETISAIVGQKLQVNPLPGYDRLLGDIIDSALDADRIDYLVRDAHTTGIQVGFINPDNLLERMMPFVKDDNLSLTYDVSALPFVEHFFYARDVMYGSVYEDDSKAASEEMLISATKEFVSALKLELDEVMLLDDMSLLHLMMQTGTKSDSYYRMTQFLLGGRAFRKAFEVNFDDMKPALAETLSELMLGQDAGVAYFTESKTYSEMITNRHSTFQSRPDSVLVAFPSPNVHRKSEEQVSLLLEDRTTTSPAWKVSRIMNPVGKIIAKSRLTVRVFVSPAATQSEFDEVRSISKDIFSKSNP